MFITSNLIWLIYETNVGRVTKIHIESKFKMAAAAIISFFFADNSVDIACIHTKCGA